MKNYKYFCDVLKNAYFTDTSCQFCGSKENCLDGAFFPQDNLESICLDCFDKNKAHVDIPEYIKERVVNDRASKSNELRHTPPVPWIQSNDWPVCCDDYMVYIGEWEQDEFNSYAKDGDGQKALMELLSKDLVDRVDSFEVLFDDLGYETAAFVFKCSKCGRITVICQDY